MTNNKKLGLRILIVLLIVLLVIIATYRISVSITKDSKGDKEVDLGELEEGQVKLAMTGIEVSENIELFISSMKDETYYFSREVCDGQKLESTEVQGNNWAILAYSGLYDTTLRQKHLDSLIMNWDVSAEDKDSGDLYTSFQLYQLYLLAEKYPILDDMDKEGLKRKLTSVGSSLITGYEPLEDFAMIIATLSRESFISSDLIGERSKDNSPEVFENAKSLLSLSEERSKRETTLLEKDGAVLKEGQCWVELARLQEYQSTKKNETLVGVASYFDKLDLSSEFGDTVLLDRSIPMNLLPCAEALLILNQKTGDVSYLEDARAILGAYLRYNWDIPERKFCNGDFGILSKRLSALNPDGRKGMVDNAYFIYLFTREGIKDYSFAWMK
jgi:hypothetical protein